MKCEISNNGLEFNKDFDDFNRWVGVSFGDIYVEDIEYGFYVAIFYPNIKEDLFIKISSVRDDIGEVLEIAFKCPVGKIETYTVVGKSETPWYDDYSSDILSPEEVNSYERAKIYINIVKYIIENDRNVFEYLDERKKVDTPKT